MVSVTEERLPLAVFETETAECRSAHCQRRHFGGWRFVFPGSDRKRRIRDAHALLLLLFWTVMAGYVQHAGLPPSTGVRLEYQGKIPRKGPFCSVLAEGGPLRSFLLVFFHSVRDFPEASTTRPVSVISDFLSTSVTQLMIQLIC